MRRKEEQIIDELILWATALVAAGVVILTEFHQESLANNLKGGAKSREKYIAQ